MSSKIARCSSQEVALRLLPLSQMPLCRYLTQWIGILVRHVSPCQAWTSVVRCSVCMVRQPQSLGQMVAAAVGIGRKLRLLLRPDLRARDWTIARKKAQMVDVCFSDGDRERIYKLFHTQISSTRCDSATTISPSPATTLLSCFSAVQCRARRGCDLRCRH
jgi:hypothetical protein